MLDDGLGDAIEVFDPVGLELIENSPQTFNELGFRFSHKHLRGAELRDDLGI